MPLYSYACGACGPFAAMRALAEFREPTACPQCGAASPRTLSVPRVLGRSERRGDNAEAGRPCYRPVPGSACACCP